MHVCVHVYGRMFAFLDAVNEADIVPVKNRCSQDVHSMHSAHKHIHTYTIPTHTNRSAVNKPPQVSDTLRMACWVSIMPAEKQEAWSVFV